MALRSEATLRLRIRTRQLTLLAALDTQRNLRRAAAAINISQPAATKLLAQLEEDLGLPLFERSARGMQPTVYGATMIRHARAVLSDFRHAHEELAALATGQRGILRVGCVASAVPDLLAPVLERFKHAHPQVRVGVTVDTSDVVLPLLARGEIDVALARLPDRATLEDIDAELLRRDRQVIAAGIDDPLARRRRLHLRELATRTWVLQPPGSPQRERVESALREAGASGPIDVIETASIIANTALLQPLRALTVLPESVARYYAARHALRILPVSLGVNVPALRLLTRQRRPLSPAATAFIALVRAHVAAARRR
jgi:DNA-binding transcriptional LysR family regulator